MPIRKKDRYKAERQMVANWLQHLTERKGPTYDLSQKVLTTKEQDKLETILSKADSLIEDLAA